MVKTVYPNWMSRIGNSGTSGTSIYVVLILAMKPRLKALELTVSDTPVSASE